MCSKQHIRYRKHRRNARSKKSNYLNSSEISVITLHVYVLSMTVPLLNTILKQTINGIPDQLQHETLHWWVWYQRLHWLRCLQCKLYRLSKTSRTLLGSIYWPANNLNFLGITSSCLLYDIQFKNVNFDKKKLSVHNCASAHTTMSYEARSVQNSEAD